MPTEKMRGMNKKGVIENLMKLVVPLVGIALVLVVGFLILAEVKTQVIATEGVSAANGSAYNATEATQNALDDIPGWLPIIIITVIGALLIGLVGLFRRGR
jgi:uncharacterized protein (UPF0333 family)